MVPASESAPHRWTFFRAGGFDQVLLQSAADLRALDQLDPKLWVALSCPASGLEFDRRSLALIDADGDGRIRVPELRSAVRWAVAMLKDPALLLRRGEPLALAEINDTEAEGAQLLASARRVLRQLGKAEADRLTVDDFADASALYANSRSNGDGIVAADADLPEDDQAALRDILATVGAETDRSGAPGVSQALLDRFYAEAQAQIDWWDAADANAERLRPLGEATEAAAAALAAVRRKIDDYFTRCRLAAFDARAAAPLNRDSADYAALAAALLAPDSAELAALPLAQVAAGRPLPLHDGINPAWSQAITALYAQAVQPLLGERSALSEADWNELCARFSGHAAWLQQRPPGAVGTLDPTRLRALLDDGSRERLAALIAQDLAAAAEVSAFVSVERLVRYRRDLGILLDNFVSFRDFYTRRGPAVFQAGTLFLDGRSCELCLKVEDEAKHGALAGRSGVFLAYCACSRAGSAEKMSIVAAFTGGDADRLIVGRNGVFFDRQGRDWDATITRLVENPISIRQAFWSPYKRVGKLIGEQIDAFAASREKAVQDNAAAGVAGAGAAAAAPKPAAPAAFDIGKFAGVFAAIGLALGAIGSALAAVVTGLLDLAWWQLPIALIGAMLLVSGPSMVIAALKLRQRNLGPILDASGWAVNARAMLNIPFGAALTAVAALPAGAQRSLADPFAARTRWGRVLLLLLLLLLAAVVFVYIHHGTSLGLR